LIDEVVPVAIQRGDCAVIDANQEGFKRLLRVGSETRAADKESDDCTREASSK
jgi:hypothetical protein